MAQYLCIVLIKVELLYYTNGQAICDSSHQKVEGGEKIVANNTEYWNL